MKNFNLVLVTKSDLLLKELKKHSISRIISVYRLNEITPEQNNVVYKENKITGFEPERNLDQEELKKLEAKLEQEQTRKQKMKKENLKKSDEEKLLELQKHDEKEKMEAEEKEKEVLEIVQLNEGNKEVLRSVLRKTNDFKKNSWVPINEIKDYQGQKQLFNQMIEKNVLDKAGDVIRFKDDIVYEHLAKTLILD